MGKNNKKGWGRDKYVTTNCFKHNVISAVTWEEPAGGAEDLLRADFKSEIRRVERKAPEEGRMEWVFAGWEGSVQV